MWLDYFCTSSNIKKIVDTFVGVESPIKVKDHIEVIIDNLSDKYDLFTTSITTLTQLRRSKLFFWPKKKRFEKIRFYALLQTRTTTICSSFFSRSFNKFGCRQSRSSFLKQSHCSFGQKSTIKGSLAVRFVRSFEGIY